MSSPSDTLSPKLGEPELFRVGTLAYTKAGLFMLFGWLLWGDFCFTLFESIGGPGILGLYLQDNFHVSNVQVNVIFNVIPQAIGIVVGPILSFKSDRHRGRNGRRIPFIMWTTPFLCIFAAACGYSDEIIAWTKTWAAADGVLSAFTLSMLMISVLVIGFSFFNEFVNTVFWYLFADVVPERFMGRFLGLFRLVGAGAGFLINYIIAEHQLTHMRIIHVSVAVLYLVGFTLMCWRVKEGEYPVVTDVGDKSTFMDKVRLYFRECFTHPIFLLLYASTFTYVFARSASMSGIFGLHLGQHVAEVQANTGATGGLATNADGSLVLSVGADGGVRLWSGKAESVSSAWYDAVRRGTLPGQQVLSQQGVALRSAALAPDGTWAAAGGDDGVVRMWRLGTASEPTLLAGHAGAVRVLAVSPDGGLLASGGADGTVRLWDMPAGTQRRSISGGAEVRALSFATLGGKLAAGSADGTVRILDSLDGTERLSFSTPGPVYSLLFTPSLQKADALPKTGPFSLAFLNWPMLYLTDVFSNESLYDRPVEQRSTIVAADAWLVSGGQEDGNDSRNAKLHVWDAGNGKEVAKMVGHKQAITALAWKSDLHVLVSGSSDSSVRVWDPTRIDDVANDNSVKSISGYTNGVTALAALAHGGGVVSASESGGLHLWNIDAGVSLRKVGIMASFFGIISLVLAYPLGVLVDRFHALRITLWASIILVPVPFISYFMVYDYAATAWLEAYKVPVFGIIGAAGMPLLISLFPKDKFGQMCSANGLVKQASQMILGLSGAVLMDWVTSNTLLTENFRYGGLWTGVGFALQAFVIWLIYREWKRLGADKGYRAPETGTQRLALVNGAPLAEPLRPNPPPTH